MNEFEQLLMEEEKSLKSIRTGDTVEGVVFDVKPDEIILNIGSKSDGILTRNEYTNEPNVDLTTVVKPGDTIEVKILKVNDGEGQVIVSSKRLTAERGNKRIEEAFNNKEVLKATVAQVLDGGLSVIVDEVRVFIPASQTGVPKSGDLATLNGQTVKFKVIEIKPQGKKAIGSIRAVLREERQAKEAAFWAEIENGKTYTGVVKSMTTYGAFARIIPGIDGLIHISQIANKHVAKPADVLKIGEKVNVKITEIDEERKRVSLSIRALLPEEVAEEAAEEVTEAAEETAE